MHRNSDHRSSRRIFSLLGVMVLLLNGCTLSLLEIPTVNSTTVTPSLPLGPTPTQQPSAIVTFHVELPLPILAGETLYLSVVDEVTGLELNTQNFSMQGIDSLHYSVAIPFLLDSIVKYRYFRQGTIPILEEDSFEQPVRYRIYDVSGSGAVDDVISSWSDSTFTSPSGRLAGQALDTNTNMPIPNILIAVGGQQVLTDSTGSFTIERLPVGTHNMVAYAIDGAYQTFQQGARIEDGLRTPVALNLVPAQMVSVNFTISIPSNSIQNAPIRLAGNLYQLGNTFGNLLGGMSSVATRMPILTPTLDGRFTISLLLPSGADIRYKYTLGDGFWNAEHDITGSFVIRQLIIPISSTSVNIDDTVLTWQAGASSPILFEVTVPAYTPVTDIISIQFNPYGWTEPIPMWPLGNNQWLYQLYGPLNMLGNFEYRYCRNDQCGIADDIETSVGHHGRMISTSLLPQDLQDTVSGWTWLQDIIPPSIVGLPVAEHQDFVAGIEFQSKYDPTWQAWIPLAIQDIQSRYANWMVFTPTWSISQASPFNFSPVPGLDPLWSDTLEDVNLARAANLNVALFPSINLPVDWMEWWKSLPGDSVWWNSWFDHYDAFATYHADLASQSGAQVLILGGDWVTPALPNGMVNGSSSGVPADAEARWQAIIAGIRSHFSGKVYWAVSYPGGLQTVPDFIDEFDGVYLLWYAPISGLNMDQIKDTIGMLLDTDIQPLQTRLQKPIIIAAAYPSTDNSAQASLSENELFQPGISSYTVNLQAQVDIYQALLMAINERDWVGGFVS